MLSIIGYALVFLIGLKFGSLTRNKKSSSQAKDGTSSASKEVQSSRKISKDKTAFDIIQEFDNDNNLFDDFRIIEASKESTRYMYRENNYYFAVSRNPKVGVDIQILHDKKTLLHYTYYFSTSYSNAKYSKQEITRSLIEGYPRDETISTIESFVKTIIHTSSIWNRIDKGLVIRDDIKTIAPIYDEAEIPTEKEVINEDESVGDNLTRLHTIITSSKESMSEVIYDKFNSIIHNMRECLAHIDRLETEKQYSLETLLQKDLEKLFLAYNELNQNSKEEVSEKVVKALTILDNEIIYVLDLFEKQNIKEVEKMVQVIEARNY